MKLHILAIAAHPDDVEISCAGTLLMHKSKGYKVGVLDLTRGELGTRGTPETRDKESANASQILGLDVRDNLAVADCFFQNDEEHQRKLITQIRRFQPDIVMCNAPDDRHPDHGKASRFILDSCFLAGLLKIETSWDGLKQDAWRPHNVFHFIQDKFLLPDFVVDISAFWSKKIESLKAYKTQFYDPSGDGPQTYISTETFWHFLEARSREMGHFIGASHGEGFIKTKMLEIKDMVSLTS